MPELYVRKCQYLYCFEFLGVKVDLMMLDLLAQFHAPFGMNHIRRAGLHDAVQICLRRFYGLVTRVHFP